MLSKTANLVEHSRFQPTSTRSRSWLLVAAFVAASLFLALAPASSAAERPVVVVTTSLIATAVRDVAGDAVVHSSNGHIHADQLRGSLDATTSNGGIQAVIAEASRPLRLDTSNGSVDLTLPRDFVNDVRVSSSNSSITMHLPGQPNAHVLAHTSNSSITCDFEIKTQGALDKNRIDGTIGNGGPLFDLSSSNGSIRLLKM